MTDLFADDPIEEFGDDLLDHRTFAEQVLRVMGAMREQTPSGVCVVAGPWGSGKSSVLNMLEAKTDNSDEWSVVSFNPWLLSDESSLVRQFFNSLASVLPEKRRSNRVRGILAGYLTAVSPVVGALQVPGVNLGRATEAAAKALANEVSLDVRKRELEKELARLTKPVLVLLDDLDRLHPDELLIVFKLVRLIGRLPNVYYILAFDEATIINLLETTELGGASRESASTFLEKMYQVSLELPPLHTSRRSLLLDGALEEFLGRHGLSFSPDDQYRFSSAYHTFMSANLRTPRQVKRYVAQLDVYYPLVAKEVDLVDFMLITFVRASLPNLYHMLNASKDELTRTMASIWQRDDRNRLQRHEDWKRKIAGAGIDESQSDSVLTFLAELFLPIRAAVEWVQPGDWEYTDLAKAKRIGSADYFDRYFHFGVQLDDVPDQLIDTALDELEAQPGAAVQTVRELSAHHGSIVFEKLLLRKDGLSPIQRSGVVHLLADIWDDLPDQMFTATKWRAGLLAAELLTQADRATLSLDRLTADSSHMLLTANVLSRIAKPPITEAEEEKPPALPEWIDEFIHQFAIRAFAALEKALDEPLEGQEGWVVGLLFRLRELTTPETVTDWLMNHLDESAWTVENLAAALVPVATAYGSGRPTKVLGHADVLDSLTNLLPLEWVLERLGGLEAAGEPMDRLTMTEGDLSFENRIRHVKAVIRMRVEQGNLPGVAEPGEREGDTEVEPNEEE